MPVDHFRLQTEYACNYPDCPKAFTRRHDLTRHKHTHCSYEERRFACPFEGCKFRANQLGGLKCHFNSVHENVRLHCDEPGCIKTFSDPSSRTKHRQKVHGLTSARRAHDRPERARDPVHSHTGVRPVKEPDSKDILNEFATAASLSNVAVPSSYNPPSDHDKRLSASHGVSSAPSSSIYSTRRSTPSELSGVLHGATDVRRDCWSIDQGIKSKQQEAHNANHPAQMAWVYAPTLPGPKDLSRAQCPHQGVLQGDQTGSSCRCRDCVEEGPVKLPTLREDWYEWIQARAAQPFPTLYPTTGHVPSSRQSLRTLTPNSFHSGPNPRILFESNPGVDFNR